MIRTTYKIIMKIKGLIFKKSFPVTYRVYSVPILKDVEKESL